MEYMSLKHFVLKIRPYFEPHILKRGWYYYVNGAVESCHEKKDGVIHAWVSGSDDYEVIIDLKFFNKSKCTCPYNDYCKHMAAVLFEVCALADISPRKFLTTKIKSANAEVAAASAHDAVAPTVSKPNKQKAMSRPQEEDSVKAWHQFFEKKRTKNYNLHMRDVFHIMYEDIKKQLFPYADRWQLSTRRQLYQLHVCLYFLKRLDSLFVELQDQFFYYFSINTRFTERCLADIQKILEEIDYQQLKEQNTTHLLGTIQFLAEHAFPEKKSFVNWSSVYQLLWWNLVDDEDWRFSEQERLKQELATANLPLAKKEALTIALMHFAVLAGDDEQAFQWAGYDLAPSDLSCFFNYVHSFYQAGHWNRMLLWLRWLKPQVKGHNQIFHTNLNRYFSYWEQIREQMDVTEEWRETMVYFLPNSYRFYSKTLLEQDRYREWIDLHLRMGHSPLDVDSSDLKQIESANLEILLPFYHQAVERYILGKNRDSYKLAVRMLKKIRTYYRKLKDEKRWLLYIDLLNKKYARLRALQEEMQKGKIIR